MRLAALSVDLDEIPNYAAIYDLEAPDHAAHAIYDHAVPRLRRLFDDVGARATFFAIGRDLMRAENRITVRALRSEGHEVGNHSQHHLYDLTRRDPETIEREIADAEEAITAATGARPIGYRSPGYTVTDEVLRILSARGYAYDSSVFPCPGYYGLKAAAIGAIAARGRASKSIVDTPAVLTAPADPYRIGAPYFRRGNGLRELPVGVTRGARLPYIGTFLTPSVTAAKLLTRAMIGRPLVNLLLHGIDLADAEDDGLAWLAPHQMDLKRRASEKEAALRAAIEVLRDAGYAFVTLEEAARALG